MELGSKNIESLLQRLEKIGIEQKLIPVFMKDLANSLLQGPFIGGFLWKIEE